MGTFNPSRTVVTKLLVDSEKTTADVIDVTADAVTTANVMDVTADALTELAN